MAYENTDVSVQRSQQDVTTLLLRNGCTGYSMVYRPPATGVEFEVAIKEQRYVVRVSAAIVDPPTTMKHRHSHRDVPISVDARAKWVEQEQRRIWRVIFFHLKDVFECAASGVMDLRDLLLPHIVGADGRTMAEVIVPQLAKMGAARALVAKGETGEGN